MCCKKDKSFSTSDIKIDFSEYALLNEAKALISAMQMQEKILSWRK